MCNTINHGNGYFGFRMDRIVIVDRLPQRDVHDCPLGTNFGSHGGEFKILCVNNLENQRVRDKLTL